MVGIEHGWIRRQNAIEWTLITLRHFESSPQGPERDATGYQGFYNHGSASLTPEIALPTIEHFHEVYPQLAGPYGMKCGLNPSFRENPRESASGFSERHYGINEGPVVLMIENYRSGLIWRLLGSCHTFRMV